MFPPPAAHLEERLVVHAEHAVAVLQQLVQGEARVVRLRHGVGHLLTRHHGPGQHSLALHDTCLL